MKCLRAEYSFNPAEAEEGFKRNLADQLTNL